jgi:branched-chain amino acid transport system substrate-binding protein
MENKKSVGKWIWTAVVIVVLIVIIALVARTPVETGPIKVGWIGPLTADGATIGQSAKDAVDLAMSEINATGGINGRQVQMIYEDGKCNGKDAVSAASKLINIDKVNVILGGLCSGETMAIAEQARKAEVTLISGCSSNPSITGMGVIRVVPTDSYQGTYAADYIYNTLGKRKVAIMAQQNDWAIGLRGAFVKEFTKLGGEIVVDESFDATVRDFKTSLTKIKSANPDLFYFLGYAESTIPALKQIKDMGIEVTLFGGDTWTDPSIIQKAGKYTEGIMYTGLTSKINESFVAKMKAKTGGSEIGECSAPSYDAANILAQAMAKTGTTEYSSLRKALLATDYKDGAYLSEIRFDSNGDLIGAAAVVKKVVDGKVQEIKSFE